MQDARTTLTQLPIFSSGKLHMAAIDPKGFKALQATLPLRPQRSAQQQEQKLKDVAGMYEKQFLREMVKAMRSTVKDSGMIPVSQAEKIFREQLDDQYVEQWGDKGGIGLADLIYDQLMQNYGERLGLKAPIARPKGPIELQGSEKIMPLPATDPQQLSYFIPKGKNQGAVLAPWESWVKDKQTFEGRQRLVLLEHDNGLQSRISYLGTESLQDHYLAGERLGIMDKEALGVHWNITSSGAFGRVNERIK